MNTFQKVLRRLVFPDTQVTYSQFGEDLIVRYLFDSLGIARPTYLDIGANHPKFSGNTFGFYKRGSRGVLVEPNPRLCNC